MTTADALVEPPDEFAAAILERLTAAGVWPSVRLESENVVFAVAHLVAPEMNVELLSVGAEFLDSSVRLDRIHNQQEHFEPGQTPISTQLTGRSALLAKAADDWLVQVARGGALVHEWTHRGNVFASSTEILGYGTTTYSFNDRLAPPGLRDRLVSEGAVQGKGWVVPTAIGPPDQTRVSAIEIC